MDACHLHRASAEPEVTQKVFMDLTCNGKPIGRLVLGLFGNEVWQRDIVGVAHHIMV